MTFLFCGFVFDSSDERETTRQQQNMPVQAANYSWLPEPAKINRNTSTTCNAWMSPYSRNVAAETPSERSACGYVPASGPANVAGDNRLLLHNRPTNITPNTTNNINNHNLNNHNHHNNQHNNLDHHHNNINHNNKNNNNNNNGSGIVILDGCRPPSATTARRFLRWFSRIGQPPTEKSVPWRVNKRVCL